MVSIRQPGLCGLALRRPRAGQRTPLPDTTPLQALESSDPLKSSPGWQEPSEEWPQIHVISPFHSNCLSFKILCKLQSPGKYQIMRFTHSFDKYLLGI